MKIPFNKFNTVFDIFCVFNKKKKTGQKLK